MTFYIIAANCAATLTTDDPVIAAADIAAVRDAASALVTAGNLQRGLGAACATAVADAESKGHAAGYAAGLAASAETARNELFALTLRAAEDRKTARTEIGRLAVEVVRRIAGRIGKPEIVAGLAEKAAAELLPDSIAVVRVPIMARDAVVERLKWLPHLTIVGDPTLTDADCLIETPLGVSHAGLDIQLDAIAKAWATGGAASHAA